MSIPAAVIVGYDAKLRPSSVTCGVCDEELLKQGSPNTPAEWIFERIVAQFILHTKQGHSPKSQQGSLRTLPQALFPPGWNFGEAQVANVG